MSTRNLPHLLLGFREALLPFVPPVSFVSGKHCCHLFHLLCLFQGSIAAIFSDVLKKWDDPDFKSLLLNFLDKPRDTDIPPKFV